MHAFLASLIGAPAFFNRFRCRKDADHPASNRRYGFDLILSSEGKTRYSKTLGGCPGVDIFHDVCTRASNKRKLTFCANDKDLSSMTVVDVHFNSAAAVLLAIGADPGADERA